MKTQENVGIITIPIGESGIMPLSNIIDIIHSISGKVFLITGDTGYSYNKENSKVNICRVTHHKDAFFIIRIFSYILLQIKISWYIVKKGKNVDTLLFVFGGDTLVIPAITAWLFKKKVIVLLVGSTIKITKSRKDRFSHGLMILQFITFTFAEKIVVYSNNIIHDYSLEKWIRKIAIAQHTIIDRALYKIKTPYVSREFIVGYCGRFSDEKGIQKLLHSTPQILEKNQSLKFLFIGDGNLKNEIEQYIINNNLKDKICVPGWIEHDFLPDYLNQMKLLVIPSDTEGLPNIMLEAMTCGTPVLATPVGSIPDIIKYGKTGFIMENNSPQCIAQNVIQSLNSPELERIAVNGKHFVDGEYSFEKYILKWKMILGEK